MLTTNASLILPVKNHPPMSLASARFAVIPRRAALGTTVLLILKQKASSFALGLLEINQRVERSK